MSKPHQMHCFICVLNCTIMTSFRIATFSFLVSPNGKPEDLGGEKKLDFASLKSFCNALKETAVNSVGSSPSAGLRLWTGFCIQVRAVSLMLTVVAAVSSHAEHGPAPPSIRARLCASCESKSLWSRTSNWSFVIVQTQRDVLGRRTSAWRTHKSWERQLTEV